MNMVPSRCIIPIACDFICKAQPRQLTIYCNNSVCTYSKIRILESITAMILKFEQCQNDANINANRVGPDQSALSLRNHAYSNILKILQSEKENFQIKSSDVFHIFARNINCGYSLEPPWQGGYPQSMFFSKKKNNNKIKCIPL